MMMLMMVFLRQWKRQQDSGNFLMMMMAAIMVMVMIVVMMVVVTHWMTIMTIIITNMTIVITIITIDTSTTPIIIIILTIIIIIIIIITNRLPLITIIIGFDLIDSRAFLFSTMYHICFRQLSMSEQLTKLAHKIDFLSDDKAQKSPEESKEEDEKALVTFQPSLWPWDSVRSKLRLSLKLIIKVISQSIIWCLGWYSPKILQFFNFSKSSFWLVELRLIDWLIDWLTDWLIGWVTDWLIG